MYVPGLGIRPFNFGKIFSDKSTQDDVYELFCRDSVIACLNGINSCFLCYGQTGTGKTHTIFGPPDIIN